MDFPKIKHVNTVGIRYTRGEREDSHYAKIIVDVLEVSEDEIGGICEMGPKRFMLKVASARTYERLCRTYVGARCTIGDDIELEVDDISTYKYRVCVTKVPFEMENYQLRVLLERYGRVENISTSYNLL